MVSKSRKHARKVTLDAAVNNAIEKAVDARKVAAFTVGAAGVLAGAAFAFGATPAMAADDGVTDAANKTNSTQAPVTIDKKSGNKPDDKGEKKEQISTNKDSDQKNESETEQKNERKNEQKNEQKNQQSERTVVKTDDKNSDGTKHVDNETGEKASTDSAPVANDPTSETNTPVTNSTPVESPVETSTYAASSAPAETTASAVPQGENRAGTEKKSNVLDFSKNLPNIYGWATPSNTFDEKLEKQEIVYHLPKKDNKPVVRVVILPDSKDSINTDDPSAYEKIIEFDSEHVKDRRQSYSGIYELKTNESDGSVDLIMKQPFSDGGISSGQGYCANRSIFLYYDKDNLQHDQTSNNFRVATLVPPKTAGSIVLKYNERLSADKVREVLHKAVNLPTEHKAGSSVADQLVAQSKSAGVGLRVDESTVNNTPDTVDAKIPKDMGSYDGTMFEAINKKNDSGDYSFGERKLKTYLVTDLGMKSPEIPLTVVRYSTRIEKPVVETVDFSRLTDDQKIQIRKNLAKLNGVSTDKVTFDGKGTATIDFDGLSPQDDPKIPLSDLVLTRVAVGDVVVPTGDKAVFVANPLGYSSAELDRIKTAIYKANKDNEKLGLSEKDYKSQISLEYVKGDTVIGHENIGISNGMAENTITVKIKTDKAFAKFTSNVKESKLTKLPNIRKDYTVSWEKDKSKIKGRDSDEGLSWSEDKKTIIYRYDPTKATAFNSDDVTKLLTATPNGKNSGLRELKGSEKLDYEGSDGKPRKSHMHYALQGDEPTGALTLGVISSGYWKGDIKITGTDVDMGDVLAKTDTYKWDDEAQPVKLASKGGKIYRARLFVAPYGMEYYQHLYAFPDGKNINNTPKAINVIFVPQTKNKKDDLSKSIGEHKLADDKKTPTESKYYNASADKKDAYDKALAAAKETLEKVGTTTDDKLSEELKAEVDNATIALNKAREALDGDDTKKEELNKSINANGKAQEGQTAASGTQATNQFKNVSDPDFKKADGSDDTERNEAAKKAKEAYDKALEEAKKVKDNTNATQTQVDDAKAKLDEARKKLNDFTTNKDELNNAIAQHGKVNTGDSTKTDPNEKLKTADPTYQNSTPEQRKAYDDAVKKADEVSKDPNASQKEVNDAIKKLKEAKAALDKNATDKSPLDAAVQKSFDNPDPTKPDKQSVFYKNAKGKTNDPDAQQAVKNYDDALKKAKDVLADKNATKKDVEDAKKALEDAEAALHADKYQTKSTDLAEAIADNVSGYLMPAYFNAFDLSQSKDPADAEKAKQAANDFKAYNDAYHAAKDLLTDIKKPNSTVTQDQADAVKKQLLDARKVIDKYATDTSKISAALLHSLAITNSPAYKNASATDASEDAKKAKQAYDDALKALQDAFDDKMPQDTVDGKPGSAAISTDNIPVKDGDTSSPDYLKNIQSHAKGQPLNRDVTKLLAKLNDAVKGLDEFKTKTDELIKSINEDDNTKQTPAYKNTKDPDYKGEDGTTADTNKNSEASAAKTAYDDALDAAKGLLKKPDATQKEINDTKTALDNARKELDKYNTDVAKLKESVDKNGKDAEGSDPAVEGTKDSDAYRNASDPHFLNDQGKPDTKKNDEAKQAKAAYDKALAEAQELISKHDDANTPLDAKPTQKQIDDALTELNKKRKALDAYKTDTSKLDEEAKKSTADGATVADADFEATPEFKNADAKKKDDDSGNKVDNDEVDAYKKALKAARDLLSKKDATNLSERPTQKQIDDALETLKKAKQAITDGYKTDATALQDEATLGEDGGAFTKSPEYKNAEAKKGEGGSDNAKLKAYKDALAEVTTMLNKFGKDGKPKANATDIPTQDQVDSALDKLSKARKAVEDEYKTDTKPLEKEVGDKDKDNKPVIPPFEESIPYKNALYKKQSETGDAATGNDSATKKLQDYNDKFKVAQNLINKVNNPDPNAKPEDRPTQAKVDEALKALQDAKKAIKDSFTTNAKALKDESAKSTADGVTTVGKDDFEATTEFKNADSKKTDDGKDNADITAYNEALKNARTLLGKFDKDGKPNSGVKDVPTQQKVDEALKKLKEIKDKITADYKTSPTELQQEVDKSKDGDKDKRDDVFENTPAFKNATAKGDDASKQALKDYNDKLEAAKKLLGAFNRNDGSVKDKKYFPQGMTAAPTQKELYDALDALQAAKKKIEDEYSTIKYDLRQEAGDDFTKSPEYQNAQAKGDDASKQALDEYKNALDEANSVLDDPNATQSEVDAALKKLQEAKAKLRSENGTDKSGLQSEADDDAKFRKSVYFIIGNKADIEAYENALAEARSVLADPNATQAQVDEALRKLQAAKYKLNHPFGTGSGVGIGSGYDPNAGNGFAVEANDSQSASVDKSALQVEVNNAVETNANTAEARAYRKALAEARRVLADENATQAQVDAALRNLKAARVALLNSLRGASGASGLKLAKTGAETSMFASIAAAFAGLGVAGVASRRRKHSNE
ncbi:LPXTG cell wall anchor domain-containing protein [Gardnerella sp. 2492-Sm]|uniref:LPXTG cell wall anchor domain-containing protein n=1 Tax=unclassified Gardnerella TaxID=2628112 RepID=UPI003D01228E